MKSLLPLLMLASMAIACQSPAGTGSPEADSLATIGPVQAAPALTGTTGMTGDSVLLFTIVHQSHDGENRIILQMADSVRAFSLQKTPVAGGTKFTNPEGYYLWMQGTSFVWGKDSLTLAAGTLRKE